MPTNTSNFKQQPYMGTASRAEAVHRRQTAQGVQM